MFDIKVKYITSIFGDFADIKPTPQQISRLLILFQDMELLPSYFTEIAMNTGTPQNRIRLSAQNNEWAILFASTRIDIEKNNVDMKGKNIGDIADFSITAQDIYKRIYSEYNKKANRMALITHELLKEMPSKQLDDIYIKLFNPIDFYKKNIPFEWNSKQAVKYPIKINELEESVNVITSIDRVRGHYLMQPAAAEIDRIQIQFDINTIKENNDARFDVKSIKDFFEETIIIRANVIRELEDYMNG